ncbi:MAG TPA: hypothetical protein VLS93_12860 [Anaeromyxobacteraceae bacterium]|nr:hypothetical protein [Anaeromyxobacteraceae bacterium]
MPWGIEPREGTSRLLAGAVYLAAVVAFMLLQEVGLRLRRDEHRAWWAGSGRDLLNAAGLVAIAVALRLLGLSWPAALLVGGTLTLLLFGAYTLFATQTRLPHAHAWAVAAGLLLALPVLAWTEDVVGILGAAAGALFPGLPAPPRP